MSDPERLSLASDIDLARSLLRAGRRAAPASARQRAILAATAALGTTGLAAGTVAAGGVGAAKGAFVLSAKWLALAGILGLGAATAAVVGGYRSASVAEHRASEEPRLVSDRPPPVGVRNVPATAASTTPAIAPVASPVPEPTPISAPEPASAPALAPARALARARANPVPPLATPPAAGSSVRAELASLDQARAALAAGDAPRALSLLDAYRASFPRASMTQEATVLRIEALARAGAAAAARRVGTAFLEAHPGTPYAARVRSLIGATNP
jgi:hypothetical protein